MTQEAKNDDSKILRCCSGFCVDLLLKFASDLSFDFQMTRYDHHTDLIRGAGGGKTLDLQGMSQCNAMK